MIKDFKFSRETYYVGRNGRGRQAGIAINDVVRPEGKNHVNIRPVNSKHMIANCTINIPVEDLPRVIESLQAIYNSYDI